MKKNNKGFTLVELIVVLVILAILAAILVPALLGWIDKAREKSVASNAEAAYVAAQGLATEYYGVQTDIDKVKTANVQAYASAGKIAFLTDIAEPFKTSIDTTKGATGKEACKITKFTYTNKEYKAVWENGNWTITKEGDSALTDVTPITNTKDMTGVN
ncbi:MAG: type II secretion system GspH family protein [Eubacterium sp.]|nr:type II secretion system GspH family protein [Eubacterium sp.]